MGRRRAIERPPLAKLGTCKFTFSSKTNPFGCQARGGAEVAGTEDKGSLSLSPCYPPTHGRHRHDPGGPWSPHLYRTTVPQGKLEKARSAIQNYLG